MNNRYTYKAKRKDNGEWVYGTLEYKFLENRLNETKEYCIKSYFKNKMFGEIKYHTCTYEIIPETLFQCTGLKDIDGKDIFENDIVSGYGNVFKATVEWNTSFCGFYPFCNEETKIFADECKIISNKFDKEVE